MRWTDAGWDGSHQSLHQEATKKKTKKKQGEGTERERKKEPVLPTMFVTSSLEGRCYCAMPRNNHSQDVFFFCSKQKRDKTQTTFAQSTKK